MTTTLNDFITQVKTVGMARTNRFNVVLTPPQALGRIGNEGLKSILLFCDQVQVPGLNLATIQNRTFGEFREVPYEKLYGDIQMSFYVDNNLAVKNLFDDWMALIQNPTSRTFEYYDNYITDMQIEIEDVANKLRHRTYVYEAYPKTIAPIQLDYASKEVMKLQITMQYKYWKTESFDIFDTSPNLPLNGFTAENLIKDYLVPESYFNDFNNYQKDWNNAQKAIKTAGLDFPNPFA
jgi:hypothetical protein